AFLDSYPRENEVVLVTINVDNSKSKWLQARHSGMYTSKRSIDLFIGEIGHNHPMLKYYAFRGFPQLVVIDKNGRLVTARAPRPISDSGIIEFKQLLDSLL